MKIHKPCFDASEARFSPRLYCEFGLWVGCGVGEGRVVMMMTTIDGDRICVPLLELGEVRGEEGKDVTDYTRRHCREYGRLSSNARMNSGHANMRKEQQAGSRWGCGML